MVVKPSPSTTGLPSSSFGSVTVGLSCVAVPFHSFSVSVVVVVEPSGFSVVSVVIVTVISAFSVFSVPVPVFVVASVFVFTVWLLPLSVTVVVVSDLSPVSWFVVVSVVTVTVSPSPLVYWSVVVVVVTEGSVWPPSGSPALMPTGLMPTHRTDTRIHASSPFHFLRFFISVFTSFQTGKMYNMNLSDTGSRC